MIFPNSRFLFAEISSELRSSEISSLIEDCLNENEKVSLASSSYYLYFNKKLGMKLLFGRKIVGFPKSLPLELSFHDFGGERIQSFNLEAMSFENLELDQVWGKIATWEEKFDQKIEKMLLSIDASSTPTRLGLDIFVE